VSGGVTDQAPSTCTYIKESESDNVHLRAAWTCAHFYLEEASRFPVELSPLISTKNIKNINTNNIKSGIWIHVIV
jgi:hypothetical protein